MHNGWGIKYELFNSSVVTREGTSLLPLPETKFDGHGEGDMLWQLGVTP